MFCIYKGCKTKWEYVPRQASGCPGALNANKKTRNFLFPTALCPRVGCEANEALEECFQGRFITRKAGRKHNLKYHLNTILLHVFPSFAQVTAFVLFCIHPPCFSVVYSGGSQTDILVTCCCLILKFRLLSGYLDRLLSYSRTGKWRLVCVCVLCVSSVITTSDAQSINPCMLYCTDT